jgi:GWxTD domain-containing protein
MKQYLTLPSSRARAKWVDRFWLELDPTPATETNERRLEYEQRIEAARRLFPSQKAPGWDDRGEMVIRYGLPESRSLEQGDVTPNSVSPPRESWTYRFPPMTVTFEDVNVLGEFSCVIEPTISWFPNSWVKNVPDDIGYTPPWTDYVFIPDPESGIMLEDIAPAEWFAYHPDNYPLTVDEVRKAIEKAPAIYSCDRTHRRLPLYFDIASFKGGDRSLRTEVNFEVPAKSLTFISKGDGRAAEVELSILVRDFDMREIARGRDVIRPAFAGDSLAKDLLLPGQVVLSLRPGYYHIGIEAYDKNSNRRAACRTTAEIAPLRRSPAISDIEFASSIKEALVDNNFMKGNLRVVPHASRTYRIPAPVVFYFEIYGLDTDDKGIAFYRVEYRIDPLEKRRWGPVLQDAPTNISSTFETSGYGSTQPQRLSIATENLWKGNFKLVVTVTDRRTLKTCTREKDFSLLK